jgi:hypothetical protein
MHVYRSQVLIFFNHWFLIACLLVEHTSMVLLDDDEHILSTCGYEPDMVATMLSSHRDKPRVYVGCMKSGTVVSDP